MQTASLTLLDRYLQYLSNYLPAAQRLDIQAELRANLQAEMDDRAEASGRPLTQDEEAEMLKQHGHPLAVASRYLPVQRLIGAPWIALYWLVLRLSLLVALTVCVVRIVIGAALLHVSGGWVAGVALQFPENALLVFAWVTLAFFALDYFSRKAGLLAKSSWDPRRLPSLTVTAAWPKGKPLSNLIAAILGLVLVLAFGSWRSFVPGSLAGVFQLSPAWHIAYEIVLAGAILAVLSAFTVVLRPHWYGLRPATELLVCLLDLGALRFVWVSAPWVLLANPGRDGLEYSGTLAMLNQILFWCIVCTMVAYAIAVVVNAWRCYSIWRKRGDARNDVAVC